jgi:CubicO group peptidase (beta-lactamase class C family)
MTSVKQQAEGGTVPSSAAQSPTRTGRHLRRPLAIGLGIIAWPLLAFFVLAATFFLVGLALPVALLRSLPSAQALIYTAVLVTIAAVLGWLVARFVASRRTVVRVVAVLLVIMLVPTTVWAIAYPDESTYLARTAAWGESDVLDYQKFPARDVPNSAQAFNYPKQLTPELFGGISYRSGGVQQQANLDELLASSDTTSFVVIKDDTIRYEGYFNGYSRDSIVTSFSTAKSITSALIGIAIDEGYIDDVNDPLIKYLPEMKGHGFDSMTIRDVLLMSTGIRFSTGDEAGIISTKFPYTDLNPYQDEAASYEHTNMRKLALGLPASDEPVGVAFKYNQYHPLLLGLILERTTGRTVSAYTSEKIWQPLGTEFPATWSLDSTKHGFEKMESGLNGRAIDFAKFGSLFLHQGTWNGQQLITRRWVIESTAPDPTDARPWLSHQDWKNADGYYKYMWWGVPRDGGGYAYAAHGHLGQLIAVFPEERVVVVRFGKTDGPVDSWDEVAMAVADRLK